MSTYTQILYHVVFSPYNHQPTLCRQHRPELFRNITGILKNKHCHLYQIGGMDDHLHIVTHIHPTVNLASLVKDIKLACSQHIKQKRLFPDFNGWQEGYGGFTCSYADKARLIRYVQNQEEHHRMKSYKQEFMDLLKEHGMDFDDRYWLSSPG